MRDNRRRNRNIGTAKQGHGQDNWLTIPIPYSERDERYFTERLVKYSKEERCIHGHSFVFIVEETLPDFYHACSVNDVAYLLSQINPEHYGLLRYIVFRQPTKKQDKLSSVWGRLNYSYQFEGERYPAIVLEAFQHNHQLIWSKKMSVQGAFEFERLKKDGHVFTEGKRDYTANLSPETARGTQLYRTVLHELGHYLQVVQKESEDYYRQSVLTEEKEKFAHAYAQKMALDLRKKSIIPFLPS